MKSLLTASVFLFSSFQLQADYDSGLAAYQQGDFIGAYSEWIKVAAGKESASPPAIRAESQYALGMLYWLGQGVTQSTPTAAVWLQEAAQLNHAGAQSKLGYLYLSGQGVSQSDFEAFKWLQMAAQQEDADAQYNLGVMYRDGLGVEKDLELAREWFSRAASNGDVVSAQVLENWAIPVIVLSADGVSSETPDSHEELMETNKPDIVAPDVDNSLLQADAVPPSHDVVSEHSSEATESFNQAEWHDDEAWIFQRNPEHFTIQIIALRNTGKIREFIDSHPDWAPFAIYEQKFKEEPLYVLIQGDYANLEAAREAKEAFPPGIEKREELWIRKFMMVQALLQ